MPPIVFKSSVFAYFLLPFIGLVFGGFSGAWEFTLLGLAFFANVVLHECGHWWMAKKYENRYCFITIGALGGSTSYSGMFMSERQLACIVAAGPLMNVLVGLLATLLWGYSSMPAQVSFCLAIFNLLPIAKLDGGQLMRILLGRYFDYPEKIASVISVLTGMGVIAYLCFNFAPLTALVGIYLMGYLFTRKG